MNLNKIFPYKRNPDNEFTHLHFPTQLYDNYFKESYSTIENNYSNNNVYQKIGTSQIELHKNIHQRNIGSSSRVKNYNNLKNKNNNINRKEIIPTQKDLFRKSDIISNSFNFDNYYYDRSQNTIYYNDFSRIQDFRTPTMFNYRNNNDINDYHNHSINYDYFINNSFFSSVNKKRSNSNHYIINTNINYNFINNGPYFNSVNKDYNNSKYNYNTEPNTIQNSNEFKFDININDEIFKLSDSEFEKYLSIIYNLDNIEDIRYLNHKDIKNIIHSEEKYQIKSKSKKNLLKDENQFKDLNFDRRYKFSKSVKYNNSFREIKFEKKDILTKKDDSLIKK